MKSPIAALLIAVLLTSCGEVYAYRWAGELLLFQHFHGSTLFGSSWEEMLVQRGYESGNYWIGLEVLHFLTRHGAYKLRLDMTAQNGIRYWEEYTTFRVENAASNYRLIVAGFTGNTGSPGGTLSIQNGMMFTAWDRDNDKHVHNCASYWGGGAWWYNSCCNSCISFSSDFFFYNAHAERVFLQYASMKAVSKW